MGAGELILRVILAVVCAIVAAIVTVGLVVTVTMAMRTLAAFVVRAVHMWLTVHAVIREPASDYLS